jgi:predicted DsbA family dithiol-disulfide isomerase
MIIPVAHDFTCPWCWIGWSQAQRLKQEFGVEFDWLSYELMPESLEWPEPIERPTVTTNRPPTPSRLDLAFAAEGIPKPTVKRPERMRIHQAMESVELAKELGFHHDWVGHLYRAYWLEGKEIDRKDILLELGREWFPDLGRLEEVVDTRQFADRIVGFDEPAYASGVYNVPTFFIGGERYAEQPYVVLRDAVAASIVSR